MNFSKNLPVKLAVGTVATLALSVGAVSAANAATLPSASVPLTHDTSAAVDQGLVGSTQGFNLYNDSAETLDYVKVTGSLPAPPTAPILTGVKVNFELPDPLFSNTHGSVYYNVMSPAGAQVANLEIDMYTGPGNSWDYKLTDMSGKTLTSMTIPDAQDQFNLHFEDAKGSAGASQTLPAASTAEQSELSALCQKGIAKCTFATVSQTTGYSAPKLLVEGYNGGSLKSSVSAHNGYTDSTTDTWGAAVTASGELGPVTSSVQASYQHSVTTSTDYSTNWTAAVPSGDTEYIWASIPQYEDMGTFTAVLDNTTWTMPGVTIYNAIPNAPIDYSNTQVQGNVPLPIDPGYHSN